MAGPGHALESRFGAVALVGRPNAGKSTLLNRLLGEKLAIVSDKPQTTRNRIVGLLSGAGGQMVLVDTPGIHKGRHRMNRRMVQAAFDSLREADVVCLLVDAAQPFGKGDLFLLDRLRGVALPRVLALNKIDRVDKPALLPRMQRYGESGLFEEIVPISARTGDGVDRLQAALWDLLPVGEPLYDPELLTVHPERFLAAERIREKVLEHTREELPFASAVRIERWREEEGLVVIHATILVEREGQRRIVIGRQGTMVKKIGTAARLDLEELLGRKVFLDLHVRQVAHWREQEGVLEELERDATAGDLGTGS